MRTGGKNRKAAATHVLLGTFQPSRHGRQALNPVVPAGRPEPPEGLPEAVLQQWQVVVSFLEAMGTVSRVDGLIIEQYCRLYVETAAIAVTQSEMAASIARLEENLSGLEGAELVQCFQEISKLRHLEARYTGQIRQGRMAQRQYLIELCLTPASRSRGVSRTMEPTPRMDPKKQRYLNALQKPSA
jgi:phage terminase small subunit